MVVPVRAIIRAWKRLVAVITGKPQPKPDGPVQAVVGNVIEGGTSLAQKACAGPSETVSSKVVSGPAEEKAAQAAVAT